MSELSRNELCVGIDLGTSNSLIATCKKDGDKLYTPVKSVDRKTDAKGGRKSDRLLPSYVFYIQGSDGKFAEPIVGDYAKEQYSALPFWVAKSIKSQMGLQNVTGLQEGTPDKTPEEVSARILKHLVCDLEKYYDEEIKDVVITVPANFDAAKREATLKAAEIAGIDVRNEDGTYDQDILLSEPEAVMYDLLNKVQNGEFDPILDFDTEKNVLVFDIGGGTLDITLHKIKKDTQNTSILDVDQIATNRFSSVAGDTFDNYVAEEMFKQYYESYRQQSLDIARNIKEKKNIIMPRLQMEAEQLKKEINGIYRDRNDRKKFFDKSKELSCGGAMPTGYNYNGYFTIEEYENIVSPLLGNEYTFDDYKRVEDISATENIIWPVLDVLRKAVKKLQTDSVTVDAVVISGGMSRLYLIENRLKEFFSCKVISVPDPDLAVAQGAVVYHYHQHQDSELMKKLHSKQSVDEEIDSSITHNNTKQNPNVFINSGKTILNESIYLGLRSGATKLLVEEGEELPFCSQVIHGFKIEKGQQKISIPIKQKSEVNDELKTIASGNIIFKQQIKKDMQVSIKFEITKSQLIKIEAWTSSDIYGMNVEESGTVTLSFGENNSLQTPKMTAPSGSELMASNEIKSLVDLCNPQYSKNKQKYVDNNKVRSRIKSISECSNPSDFAEPILKAMSSNSQSFYFHVIPLARELSYSWNDSQKYALAEKCKEIIESYIYGFNRHKSWNAICSEAIKTIGYCGTTEQIKKISVEQLKNDPFFRSALLDAFAKSGTELGWIYVQFMSDTNPAKSSLAIGVAMQRSRDVNQKKYEKQAIEKLITYLTHDDVSDDIIVNTLLSLGLICDRRPSAVTKAEESLCEKAKKAIEQINLSLPDNVTYKAQKAQQVALKMIGSQVLESDDEQFLLDFLG